MISTDPQSSCNGLSSENLKILRIFHPTNSLILNRNRWLNVLSKIKSSNHQKFCNSKHVFYLALSFYCVIYKHESFKAYLEPKLPPCDINWQLIFSQWVRFTLSTYPKVLWHWTNAEVNSIHSGEPTRPARSTLENTATNVHALILTNFLGQSFFNLS
jgi:hypothetical protein